PDHLSEQTLIEARLDHDIDACDPDHQTSAGWLHDVHPSEPHFTSSAHQGVLAAPCWATPLPPLQLARPPSKSLRSVVFPARKLLGAQAAPPPRRHPSGPLCCARHAPDNRL